MNEFFYFASPIYRYEKPEWVDSLLKSADAWIEAGKDAGQCGCVIQSALMSKDKNLGWLKTHLIQKAREILTAQKFDMDINTLTLSDMWAQEFGRYGHNIQHVHGNSVITGLIFLKTPEKGAYPMFKDPRPGAEMCGLRKQEDENINLSTDLIHFLDMQPGSILLFNSYLPHMVGMSNTDEKTVFLHFMISANLKGV